VVRAQVDTHLVCFLRLVGWLVGWLVGGPNMLMSFAGRFWFYASWICRYVGAGFVVEDLRSRVGWSRVLYPPRRHARLKRRQVSQCDIL
jgi:hypothetical protein